MGILYFSFWTSLLFQIHAEYRVFQIQVIDSNGKILIEEPSTLDPWQYPAYFPLPKETYVQYTKTWLCPNYTGHHKPLCKNPNLDSSTDPSAKASPEASPLTTGQPSPSAPTLAPPLSTP